MPERYQLEVFMGMYDEKVVLCGANSYEEKYYLNPDFEQLPDDVKNELKIMCVLYVHDVCIEHAVKIGLGTNEYDLETI